MFHSRKRFESWLPALFDGPFDWDFLDDAWEGKIKPMDFDAVVERRGHFLIFETKIPGQDIPKGQRITLSQKWRHGKTTIFILSGKSPSQINGMAEYIEGHFDCKEIGNKPIIACDAYDVLYRARCWFCWASGKPVPSRKEWDNELWQLAYARACAIEEKRA
jgi:hypothetical protein